MFDIGGSFGVDLGAMGEGGGFFGGGVFDPAADAFKRSNQGRLSLENQGQQQSNKNTLAFDRASFAQKMAMADEFGINKLSMLGTPSSGGSSPSYVSTGSANFSGQAQHSVKADPQETAILNSNARIAEANARSASANAEMAEMDLAARRQSAVTSVGRSPFARVSNDKVDSILKTVNVNGKPFELANPAALQEQYNYGENFTALINAGVDPRLALSLSAVDLMNPTSWFTPAITTGSILKEKLGLGAPFYDELLKLGYRPGPDGTIRVQGRR